MYGLMEQSQASGLLRKVFFMMLPMLFAVWALSGQFASASWENLEHAWQDQSATHVTCAMVLTGLSFACLGLFDWTAARVVAPGLGGRWAWMTGMVANAVSNTLGFHAVTGTVVRARLYARHGLGTSDVVRIVSLSWLALGMGFVTMLGMAELVRGLAPPHSHVSLVIGLSICASLGFIALWLGGAPRQFSLWRFRQPLPTAHMALQQMAIGAVESAAAIGALYVLLPADLAPPFSVFAVGCIAAVTLGVLSHVPGGLGVFEASVTVLLAGGGRADLLAALLLYRGIYNLLPFVLSLVVLAVMGVSGWTRKDQFDGG
jgi:phosphatidylglycerol lysyltransferase